MDNATDIFLIWNNAPDEEDVNQSQYKSTLVQDHTNSANSNIKTGDGYYITCFVLLIVVALLFCLISSLFKRLKNFKKTDI